MRNIIFVCCHCRPQGHFLSDIFLRNIFLHICIRIKTIVDYLEFIIILFIIQIIFNSNRAKS